MELQDLGQLTCQDFIKHLNQEFMIKFTPDISLSSQLIEAKEIRNYSPLERTPFSIVFRTSQKNEYYLQAIFTVVHPERGDLPMFLSPKGFDAEGMKYEAIFS